MGACQALLTMLKRETSGIEHLHAGLEGSENVRWLSVETIGRALSRYFQIVSVRDVWPDAATNALSLVPPLFAIDAAPQTPPRPAPPADEYASPYTRGRNIVHRGALVVD